MLASPVIIFMGFTTYIEFRHSGCGYRGKGAKVITLWRYGMLDRVKAVLMTLIFVQILERDSMQ